MQDVAIVHRDRRARRTGRPERRPVADWIDSRRLDIIPPCRPVARRPLSSQAEHAALLRLLGNEVRWRLVAALASSDRRVNELVQAVGELPNLVSYHLGQLRSARMVSERRSSADARDVYYSLELERLRAAFERCAGAIHPGLWPAAPDAAPGAPSRVGRAPSRVLFLCTHNSARS